MTIEGEDLLSRRRGRGGRPPVMADETRLRVKPLLKAGARVVEIARLVGLDTLTIYKYRAELLAVEVIESGEGFTR